jgi:hypothetical protein
MSKQITGIHADRWQSLLPLREKVALRSMVG